MATRDEKSTQRVKGRQRGAKRGRGCYEMKLGRSRELESDTAKQATTRIEKAARRAKAIEDATGRSDDGSKKRNSSGGANYKMGDGNYKLEGATQKSTTQNQRRNRKNGAQAERRNPKPDNASPTTQSDEKG